MNPSISSASQTFSTAKVHTPRKPKDIQDLEKALESGDLDGAKKAFANIQAKFKQFAGKGPNDLAQNQFAQSFDSIGKALEAGDVKGALSAFQKLESGIRGHHRGAPPVQPPSDQVVTNPPLGMPGQNVDISA